MPWDQSSEDKTVLLFGEILNPTFVHTHVEAAPGRAFKDSMP